MTKMTLSVAAGLLAVMLAVAPDAGAGPPPGALPPGPPPPGGFRPPPGAPPSDASLYRQERFIALLYQGFLHRRPSPEEVRSWSAKMGGGVSPGELVRFFMDSDEYFIWQTYRGLLGRDPDPSGMDAYSRALRGGESRAAVVEGILRSEEFRKRMR